MADAAVEALKGPFAVLDKALAKTGWLVGGRFTVADLNVAEIVRYAQAAPGAVRRGAAREGLARRLPGTPGLQEDVGRPRRRAGVAGQLAGAARVSVARRAVAPATASAVNRSG